MGIFGENNRPGFDVMANIYSAAPFPDASVDREVCVILISCSHV
jgi:hypothetical protein